MAKFTRNNGRSRTKKFLGLNSLFEGQIDVDRGDFYQEIVWHCAWMIAIQMK